MSNYITNKKAHFNYEILEKYTAGIELLGFEVKSIRKGQGSLDGSRVLIRGGEAYLIGSYIPPYQIENTSTDYDPHKNRRLLLTKKEIFELEKQSEKKGLTIVPISVYNKGKRIKIDIALVRGKKQHDKRETIKKKDALREINRELKDR